MFIFYWFIVLILLIIACGSFVLMIRCRESIVCLLLMLIITILSLLCAYVTIVIPSSDFEEIVKTTNNTVTHRKYNLLKTKYEDIRVYKDKTLYGKIVGVNTYYRSSYVDVNIKTSEGELITFNVDPDEISKQDFETVKIVKHYWPTTYYTWGECRSY